MIVVSAKELMSKLGKEIIMSTKWTSVYSFYILPAKKVRKIWKKYDNVVDFKKAVFANAKWSRTALRFIDIAKMAQSQDVVSSFKEYMSIDYAVVIYVDDGQYISFCVMDMTFLFIFFAPLSHKSKKEFFRLYRFFDEVADSRLYDTVTDRRGTAEK